MKTSLDLVNIVYQILKGNTALTTALTGSVYKVRPAGSTKEDIVINSIGVDNMPMQYGVVNVNIHVPNKTVKLGSIQDSVPDTARFKTLTDMVIALVDDVWAEDYNMGVQRQSLIKEQGVNEHYSNVRIEFNLINLN